MSVLFPWLLLVELLDGLHSSLDGGSRHLLPQHTCTLSVLFLDF